MKRLILGLFMVFGLAVSVANAESKTMAEEAVEGFERIKAKYPKSYNACINSDYDSKYYYDSVCDALNQPFTLHGRGGYDWRTLVERYGEEEAKKMLLKYGMSWFDSVGKLARAEEFAKISERR